MFMKILLNILFVLFFTLSCKLQIGTLNSVLDIYLDASDDVSKNIISPATTTVLYLALFTCPIALYTIMQNFLQ